METNGGSDVPRFVDLSPAVTSAPSVYDRAEYTIDPDKIAQLDRGFRLQIRDAIQRMRLDLPLPTQPEQSKVLEANGDSTIDPGKLANLEDRLSADASASIQKPQ